ncbi:hypothetical protein AURDEDRAFT_175330 [Auricularia subglabra TFB-10046 SS5]|nr:hypothetical protein AURDEDRAFT_175330 [Auricularia subglabra TFB-10046 SS5]
MHSSALLVRLACTVFAFSALAAAQTAQAPLSTPDEVKQIACFTACEDQIQPTIASSCNVAAGDSDGTVQCLCNNNDAIGSMNTCLAQICPEYRQVGFAAMYATLCGLADRATSQAATQAAAQCAQSCRARISQQIAATCPGGDPNALVDRCTCDTPPLRAAFDSCVAQTCPQQATAASLVAVAACDNLPPADPVAAADPTATDASGGGSSPTNGAANPSKSNAPDDGGASRDGDNASARAYGTSVVSWALAAAVAAALL